MRINWTEFNRAVNERVQQIADECDSRMSRCALLSANELRNSANLVLRGSRGGRSYRRIPGGRSTYTASAPGEPPAVRSGTLRVSWTLTTEGGGMRYKAAIESPTHYAGYLEEGTRKMAPRPFKEKIQEKAAPRIRQIIRQIMK